MARLLQNLLSQRYAGLLGMFVLVLVTYLVGWLAGAPWLALHLTAGGIVLAGFGAMFWQRQRAAKGASALEAALKAQGQSHAAGARPDQRAGIEELKGTFDESLDLLRSSKMGRGALHSIPWYILIGPPGSGKSTLLRESGLSFPYMTKGRSAIRGLGGTKNCDWWFADRGILLDTAGRYTTEAEDRDEWMAFLRMMKRGRGRRPINGAIVAIGLAEIVEATDAELSLYAENVRDRIDELTRELQIVFPIYLVFTKCDRLRGFVETFDTLNKEQRKQVWGFTFPFERGKDFQVAEQFGKEFDELYKALCVRRVELLASDHFKKRKAQVYAFPLQFLSLRERLQGFLSQVQQPNPYQEVSPVRGIYFTSGTQEGTTIDKILKVLRPADLELDVPQESRRCYFVDDVFNHVMFPDATMAAPTARSLQRDRRLRLGGAIALAVLAIVVIVWRWGVMAEFSAACSGIEASIVKDDDEAVLRKALDAQLELLDARSHHLTRGGVIGDLQSYYGTTLQRYAAVCIGRVADTGVAAAATAEAAAKGKEREAANQILREAMDRLARIDDGVGGLLRDGDNGRDAALRLWHDAVGTRPLDERHFDNLRTVAGRRIEVPTAAREARTRLQLQLATDDERDLLLAKRLAPAELFAESQKMLAQRQTRLKDLQGVSAQHWGRAALEASIEGPLFSELSTYADALSLEKFFATFWQDVEDAKARPGAISGQPLRNVAGGDWVTNVESRRDEFLRQFRDEFGGRWSRFLETLEGVARAGGVAPDDDQTGIGRLAVMPTLVAAYRVAAEVLASLEQRKPLADDSVERLKATTKTLEASYAFERPAWAQRPGAWQADRKPDEVIARARAANTYLEQQRQRIERSEWLAKLGERLRSLELALVESVCQSEWGACRKELQVAADKLALVAWAQMVAGFPFAADAADEADAKELQAGISGMLQLAEHIRALEPARAFELDDTFAAQMRAAADLGRMLYGGAEVQPKPNVVVEVLMQLQSAVIQRAILEGNQDRKVTVPGSRQTWTFGEPETLKLTIETAGPRYSIRDLRDVQRQQVPDGVLFSGNLTGVWALKRLCTIGSSHKEGEDRCICELTVRGIDGSLYLFLRTTRAEAAGLFDGAWPGEQFQAVRRLWKRP
jgi:hypothetical protein